MSDVRVDVKRSDVGRALGVLRGRKAYLILVDRRSTPAVVRAGVERVLRPGATVPEVLVPGEYELLVAMAKARKIALARPFAPAIGGRRRSGEM